MTATENFGAEIARALVAADAAIREVPTPAEISAPAARRRAEARLSALRAAREAIRSSGDRHRRDLALREAQHEAREAVRAAVAALRREGDAILGELSRRAGGALPATVEALLASRAHRSLLVGPPGDLLELVEAAVAAAESGSWSTSRNGAGVAPEVALLVAVAPAVSVRAAVELRAVASLDERLAALDERLAEHERRARAAMHDLRALIASPAARSSAAA